MAPKELDTAIKWAKGAVSVVADKAPGVAARISASAELPLPPPALFELLVHPDGALITRGINRCTYRKVISSTFSSILEEEDSPEGGSQDGGTGGRSGGDAYGTAGSRAPTTNEGCISGSGTSGFGTQTVEVENESDWHFLMFKGSIRTRMAVVEDHAACTMHVQLAPGGNAPLQLLDARWKVAPGSGPGSSLLTLEQEVHPHLPGMMHGGFRNMAAKQVRKFFEDLYAEALRIKAGRPSLQPYALVAHTEIDPDSVLGPAPSISTEGSGGSAGSGDPGSPRARLRSLSNSLRSLSSGLRSLSRSFSRSLSMHTSSRRHSRQGSTLHD